MKRPVVNTKKGMIEGLQKDGYKAYLGIRYAKAPVGDLRFRAPEETDSWEGIYQADHFGNICLQTGTDGFYKKEFYSDPEFTPEMSEDCLYLNIWVPDDAMKGQTNYPVAMYIHGGAFVNGYGSEPEFDGAAYAKRGVILVTINYRLGFLGFLAHPWMSAENEAGLSGNYGTLDQIAALKWIHQNIADFGGDPENITVFGQSAGAMSTQTICSSPLTKGLIAKAILQSGGSYGKGLHRDLPLAEALKIGEKITELLGVKSIEELRAVPLDVFASTYQKYTEMKFEEVNYDFTKLELDMIPVIDGYVLEKGYYDLMDAGELHNIPYMIGSTSEDIAVTDEDKRNGKKGMLYEGILSFSFKEDEVHNNPSYVYYFRHPLPGDDAGAFHSAELWYMFGTLERCWRPMNGVDRALSNRMLTYWTNFMKYSDPNGDCSQTPVIKQWRRCTDDDPYIEIFG